MEITIEQLKNFSPNLTAEINSLLMQLKPNAGPLNDTDVQAMIRAQSNRFFVARESVNNKIVGMLTLIVIGAPSGKKALLEDVVVDKDYQRKGIGTKLVARAMDQARKESVIHLDLTSNQKRIAANKFYQRLGFKKRDTNIYRMEL